MSKKQHDFYYTFTSPPVAEASSSTYQPTPPVPSKSTTQYDSTLPPPPSYDEAFSSSASITAPSPTNPSYDGYVLDTSTPPFSLNMPTPANTSDYYDNPNDISADPSTSLSSDTSDDPFRGRPAPPGYSIHRAKYKVVKDGIVSRDKHINEDGEALVQFLYQHNKPPHMKVHFYGYHEETTWRTQSTRNSDGELVQERVPTTRRIDDFQFDIDCTDSISPVCQGVYILPDPKTGEQKTLRQLCDDYCHSQNRLKELKMTKEVAWDYNSLTRALTSAIRDTGFYETIEITYVMENHEVVVKTDHKISRWADNKWARLFIILTCLWIIVIPTIWLMKKKFGHSNLKSAWRMNVTERDWYNQNIQQVIYSCRSRDGGGFF